MVTFAPSLMCMDFGKMKEQFAVMDQYVNLYHVDIMDGICKYSSTPGILELPGADRNRDGCASDDHGAVRRD